jgi:flagellin-like hook-associated protein FlgL
MANIIPIPTTRVSNQLIRSRLLSQLQADQLDIFRLQNQVSTGRRITVPSEDATAAQRAVTLQRLLERKNQLRSNVDAGLSFLGATDTALTDVATLLGDIRGSVLGVAGTTSSDQERQAVATEVSRALEQLLQTGNRKFRGRYLFTGSQTDVSPYSLVDGFVKYSGNEKNVNAFADINVLTSTNAAGVDVFGGVASQVLGGVDLNPQVNSNTPLSSLRDGRGISPNGSLLISDGVNSRVVDISRASTLGDVARLIEENPPAGRAITASVTAQGLSLQLDSGGGGNLTVNEVGAGKAASQLRILETSGVGTGVLTGGDLDPIVTNTTRITDLLGSKARARLISAGDNNDIHIEAAVNGAAYDGVTVQLVDDEKLAAASGIGAGSEYAQYDAAARQARASLSFQGAGNDLVLTAATAGTAFNNVRIVVQGQTGLGDDATASYDSNAKRLTITVDDAGATTVQKVIDAVNNEGTFTAAHDPSVEGSYNASALIGAADVGVAQGDTGNSGGAAKTLYVYIEPGASTANHVVAAINAQGTFTARLDQADTSSATFAGTQFVALASTATTTGGSGANFDKSSGIRVVNGGATHVIQFTGVETVEDLLNALNGSDAGLLAEINAEGTGVNVRSRLSGGDFQIGENGGQTATQLGIRSLTGATRLADANYGAGIPTATGTDFRIIAQDGSTASVNLDFDLDASSPQTFQDVIDLINAHASNNTGGVAVLARLSTTGNGIELVDQNGRPLVVQAIEGSQAAEYLGLLPEGSPTITSTTGTITGSDRNYLETESVYTTLVRLREALLDGDLEGISRAVSLIDEDLDRVTFARSDVGARQQALEFSARNLEDEDVQLQTALSGELDVDLVEAISNLTARQVSLEASLRTTASILQLSLLNFL